MIAIGAGGLDVAVCMAGHAFELPCPKIVGVFLENELPRPWIQAKDVILELLRRRGVRGGRGAIFEFTGPGVATLSYSERGTIANMIAELGAIHMWEWLPAVAVPVFITHRAYLAFAGRREDEHRHREVIESLNEGMAVVQSDERIVLWNDALERILGIPREHALGRRLVEAVPELAATMVPHLIRTVLETGKTQTVEHLAIHREGVRRILQVRVFVFLNGVTVFWHDITDLADSAVAGSATTTVGPV